MSKEALIIFMRTPVPGKVKTRLAASIGEETALEVYKALLDHSRAIAVATGFNCYLFHTGGDPDPKTWSDPPFKWHEQVGNDLGKRMEHAFEIVFEQGAEKAIIIGTDCFDLSDSVIKEAFSTLDHHDVVIGPAEDGGYYLLGMKTLYKPFFASKSWSTSTVFRETISDCKRLKLDVEKLLTLNDIDTVEDLQRSGLSGQFISNSKHLS